MLWKLDFKNEELRMKKGRAGLLPTVETGEGLAFLNSCLLSPAEAFV